MHPNVKCPSSFCTRIHKQKHDISLSHSLALSFSVCDIFGPRAGPMHFWATCFLGRPNTKSGRRTVPGPSARHGGLGRHGPVARWPYGPLPYRAVPGTGPGWAGRCSSLLSTIPTKPDNISYFIKCFFNHLHLIHKIF